MSRVNYVITRAVSPAIVRCELTFVERAPIEYAVAVRQHDQYVALLRSFGLEVLVLPAADRFPDCCFVEDTAVVFDEVAVIARMGSESRRGEESVIEAALARHRPLVRMEAPATLDGGDVLQLGRTVYVGLSGRTNEAGIAALREALTPYDYRIESVPVTRCLHLKSACAALDDETVVINPMWLEPDRLPGARTVSVPEDEPLAAEVLRVNGRLCMHDGFPRTRALLESRGFEVHPVDLSEFIKAEAGPTCLSLLFS
jgi:dimethylargininase